MDVWFDACVGLYKFNTNIQTNSAHKSTDDGGGTISTKDQRFLPVVSNWNKISRVDKWKVRFKLETVHGVPWIIITIKPNEQTNNKNYDDIPTLRVVEWFWGLEKNTIK